MSFRSRIKDFILIILLVIPHIVATFVVLGSFYSFSLYTLLSAVAISFTNILVLAFLFESPSIFTRILSTDFKNVWRNQFWTAVEVRFTKTNSFPRYNIVELEDWCKQNCIKKWDRNVNIFRFKNKREAVFFKTVWK